MSKTLSAGVKMVIFTVVTLLATGLLAITIMNSTFTASTSYRAVFSDAINLTPGDEVSLAGVRVGTVSGVSLYHGTEALVTFSVDNTVQLSTSTMAVIRYLNLIGERYLALVEAPGATPSPTTLRAGATIPISRTEPALNLNSLFNGFQPLLQGLDPTDVNDLSYEIVQVLQGEGGTVDNLLAQVGSLTNTLANHDALIGSVITDLNAVLGPIDMRDAQLTAFIDNLQAFISGVSGDRVAISDALTSINDLASTTAGLLADARPGLKTDIAQLGILAEKLDTTQSRATLLHFLRYTPFKLQVATPETSYGAFLNFYVCAVNFILPDGTVTSPTINSAARCHL